MHMSGIWQIRLEIWLEPDSRPVVVVVVVVRKRQCSWCCHHGGIDAAVILLLVLFNIIIIRAHQYKASTSRHKTLWRK